jgi:hypothetical protein
MIPQILPAAALLVGTGFRWRVSLDRGKVARSRVLSTQSYRPRPYLAGACRRRVGELMLP